MSTEFFNALGIFGRLEAMQEAYFASLQQKHYELPQNSEALNTIPHLSLVVSYKVSHDDVAPYVSLLKQLRTRLPLTVRINGTRIVNGHNIAVTFSIDQTEAVRALAGSMHLQEIIETDYLIVMREAPEAAQHSILEALKSTKTLTISDFMLCADRIDSTHILHSSSEFQPS